MSTTIEVYSEDGKCSPTVVDDRSLAGDRNAHDDAVKEMADLWDLLPRVGSTCSDDVAEAKQMLRERSFCEALGVLEQSGCQDAESLNLRGVLHELLGRPKEAREHYGKAMAVEKEFFAAEMNLRRCYELSTLGSSDIPLLV